VGIPERVVVVHPGVDLSRFCPGPRDDQVRRSLGAAPEDLLVGIVGRVDPRKGVQVLVEAMGMVQGELAPSRLVVVGDTGTGPPAFKRDLEARAREVLGDRVVFAGRRNDVPDVMRALDVLVNASVHEPFGLTVLEAMACGTPVIGTRAGGVPEFVTDGESGLLVPPFDAAALARAIERMLGDPALRERLGAEGARVALDHGIPRQHDALCRVYEQVTHGRSAQR
jgi:glycosyltransferase involved in cell wall biosynthesis